MLDLVDECSNIGQQLDGELVASLEKFLRILSCTNARRGTSQDNCTGKQSGTLGEEANQLRDGKDQVTAAKFNVSWCYFVYQKQCGAPSKYNLRQGAVLHHPAVLKTTDLELAGFGQKGSRNEDGAYRYQVSAILLNGIQRQ